MPHEKENPINAYSETSVSTPEKSRPTDKQMGLGTYSYPKLNSKKGTQEEKRNSDLQDLY